MLKKIFLIFIFIYSVRLYAENSYNIDYVIRFDHTNTECIDIESSFLTDESGNLTVQVPQKGISSLQLNSKYSALEDIPPFFKKITFPEPGKIGVRYKLCMANAKYSIDYPILTEKYFQLLVYSALIFPNYSNNTNLHVNIILQNVPADFRVFSSNGEVFSNKIYFDGSADLFSTFVLFGAKENIEKINIGKKSFFAMSNDAFSSGQISNYKKILSFQLNLMKDNTINPELLTFVTYPDADLYARHFTNSVLLSIPTDVRDEMLMRAFSHEYFHRWLGWKLRAENSLGDLLWFIEGVDDFFGINIAFQSGATTFQGYLNTINDVLKEYYLSPISDLDYNILSENFYDNFQYRKMAQIRGYLAAFMNSTRIEDVEKHPFMLVIKKLINSKSDNIVLTSEKLDKNFRLVLGGTKWLKTKGFIKTGKELNLPSSIINSTNAMLLNKKTLIADYGFDLNVLFKKQVVAKLKHNTAAFKSGLRDGMEVIYHDIALSRPTDKVTMNIRKMDKIIKIQFIPEKTYALIPQFCILGEN